MERTKMYRFQNGQKERGAPDKKQTPNLKLIVIGIIAHQSTCEGGVHNISLNKGRNLVAIGGRNNAQS